MTHFVVEGHNYGHSIWIPCLRLGKETKLLWFAENKFTVPVVCFVLVDLDELITVIKLLFFFMVHKYSGTHSVLWSWNSFKENKCLEHLMDRRMCSCGLLEATAKQIAGCWWRLCLLFIILRIENWQFYSLVFLLLLLFSIFSVTCFCLLSIFF